MTFLLKWLPSLAPALGPLLNPWVLLAFLAWTVAVGGFSGFQGYRLGMNKLFEYKAAQAAAKVVIVNKIVKLAGEIRERWLTKEGEIQTVYRYINKEAENVPSRADCNVTAGWMRVHDAAAGADRRIEGAVDDAADTHITEARAVETVAANYQAFHQVANDLIGCRAFVSGLGKITADSP